MKKLNVLDLFSGCGGLSYGFQQAGFNVVAGVDNWKDALLTFKENHKESRTILMNLATDSSSCLTKEISENIDVIIGGPPCQGFSISGKRDPKDPRNLLYKAFLTAIENFSPQVFVMENVPNLVSMSKGKIRDKIVHDFERLGYEVYYKVLLASDYGVPQNRRRVMFIGVPKELNFAFPVGKFTNRKVTCEEAISDFPESGLENGHPYITPSLSSYQEIMRKGSRGIYNHQITQHSTKTIETIALVPDGGNYKDLPEHLQNTRKVNIAWTRYSSTKPSLTIDTGHRHHFHYQYNRVPTVRESARLQSFPDSFIFHSSKTSQYKQVGNAVPPIMAKELALAVLESLTNKKKKELSRVPYTEQLCLPIASY